jgi:acyl carrier protein
MEKKQVVEQLKGYIVNQVLDGKSIGLDETTPLLEWGIMNSIEIVRLLDFTRKEFGVEIPPQKLVAANFSNLSAIAELIVNTKLATTLDA